MLKKVLVGVGILVLILGGSYAYLNNRNRTLSPPGEEVYMNSAITIDVKYSRPSVRDRLIFGAEADGALQPYGSYWRLGANEVTTIEFNKSVLFNGQPLDAGKYGLYAIPGAQTFIIGVNAENDRWGYSEPDYEKDILQTEVPVTHLDTPIEQNTVRITSDGKGGAIVYFEWSDVQLAVPVTAK